MKNTFRMLLKIIAVLKKDTISLTILKSVLSLFRHQIFYSRNRSTIIVFIVNYLFSAKWMGAALASSAYYACGHSALKHVLFDNRFESYPC